MTHPQTKIQQRIRAKAKELGMSPEEISESLALSPLYGEVSYSTYRNLVTWDFESGRANRVTFNKQFLIALSSVFECPVSELATDYEMESIRDLPYRRAQWPKFLLESEREDRVNTRVPTPGKTATIVNAYMQQLGITNYTTFAVSLTNAGYPITGKQLARAISSTRHPTMTRKYVTYELCEAAAKVFERRDPFHQEFRAEWLVTCRTDGRCPHCDPRLISY